MAFEKGDRVRWNAVNGVISGTLERDGKPGEWLVRLDNGKSVIVNENSFIYD